MNVGLSEKINYRSWLWRNMSPRPTVWLVDPFLIDFGWSDGADTHTQHVLVDTFIWYFLRELFTIKNTESESLPWGLCRRRSGCACAPDQGWFQQRRNAFLSRWTHRVETGGSAGRPLNTLHKNKVSVRPHKSISINRLWESSQGRKWESMRGLLRLFPPPLQSVFICIE